MLNKARSYAFRKRRRRVRSTARKALKEVKQLKKFVNKTIEMKQVNYAQSTPQVLTTAGVTQSSFLQIATGAEDGTVLGSTARVGNSVTLMKQQVHINLAASATDVYNQFRVIICESLDGNQPLTLPDVLQYGVYATYGLNVFSSPYTTKTTTNRRYKIHMDKYFELSGFPTKGGKGSKIINQTIRYGKTGKVLDYAGAGSLNPNNHRLTILLISDSAVSDHPSFVYSVRSSYKDA